MARPYHRAYGTARCSECPREIDVDNTFPIRVLEADCEPVLVKPGVIHEDRDSPVGCLEFGECRLDIGLTRDIALNASNIPRVCQCVREIFRC